MARAATALAVGCAGLHGVMVLTMPGFVSVVLLAVTLLCLGCVVGLRHHAGPRPWIAMAGLSAIALALHALMDVPAGGGATPLLGHSHTTPQPVSGAGILDAAAHPLMAVSSALAMGEIALCVTVAAVVRYRMRRTVGVPPRQA